MSDFPELTRRHLLAAIAAGLFVPGLSRAARAGRLTPVLQISTGRIRGTSLGEVNEYLGIPYGADTTGAARFQPPGPVNPWLGIRDAKTYGPTAPQQKPSVARAPFSWLLDTDVPQGEDCLVLNVWAPANGGGRKPVLVWLHGGGFMRGSASLPVSNGVELAKRENVVVVSLNHRLNAFGFLDVGALDAEFDGAVNVGMLDIVAALKWVQDNIAEFGGDPSRVMIFGESGGGRKVSTLMAMPLAKGLFHAAAIQSAGFVQANNRDESAAMAHTIADALDLRPPHIGRQLQLIPRQTLVDAIGALRGTRFYAAVDGEIFPRHPFTPDAPEVSADVPLIIGFTRTELTYINAVDRQSFTLDEAGLLQRLDLMFEPEEAKAVLGVYRARYPDESPSGLFFLIGTDQWLRIASIKVAERRAAKQSAPTFLYRFDWETPVDGGKWRAPHTIDIPHVFQTVRNPELADYVGDSPNLVLASQMSGAWAALARSGRPDHDQLPKWPEYTIDQRATMIFDDETRIENDPESDIRLLMDEIAFRTPGGRGDRALATRRSTSIE